MSTLTNKAIMLGMANLAAGLPMLLLTMAGGSAADRFDKRKILLATTVRADRARNFHGSFDHRAAISRSRTQSDQSPSSSAFAVVLGDFEFI